MTQEQLKSIWRKWMTKTIPQKRPILVCHVRRHVDRKRRRIHGDTRTTEVNMAEMNGKDDTIEEAYLS